MARTPTASRFALVTLAAAGWLTLAAAAAGAQSTSVGLSAVRALRVGNDFFVSFTPQPSDRLAEVLASGDFNGDGADDLALGLPFDNGSGSGFNDSGSVEVRYATPGQGLAGAGRQYLRQQGDPAEPGDRFGSSLASCDFNADGYHDLAVGVPREDYQGADDAGIVHVFYGSSFGLDPTDSYFAQSTAGVPEEVESLDQFGHSLACGDFDGDGFDDLAVGAPTEKWDTGLPCEIPPYNVSCDIGLGNVFVVPGSASGLAYGSTINLGQDGPGMIDEAESGDVFGWALAAGDFDEDSFDDLVIGVPGEEDEGAIQVVFGGPSGPEPTRNVLLHQDQAGGGGTSYQEDVFGSSLAAGDFDGDGAADVAVSAPYKDCSSGNDCGQATVLFGAAGAGGGFDLARTQVLTEDVVFGAGTGEGNDFFGFALASGDFDRDGFDDLAIGHPNETIFGAGDGAVTVLTGFAGGISFARRRQFVGGLHGVPGNLTQAGERFGHALAGGDFDGDGHTDLAIGSPFDDQGSLADVGSAAVLHGALFADGVESGNTGFWPQNFSWPSGNKVQVTTSAKLGPLSSKRGLQVDLFNPTIHTVGQSTFVRVGPETGFNNERTLAGQFFIDAQSLTMSPNAGANLFQMVAFAATAGGTGGNARLAFDLVRTASNYSLLANFRNDALGALQFAGSGVIANLADPSSRNIRIEFEWRAGNPGHLTMWRTRFVNGAPDATGRVQMFSADLPSHGSAVVNHVYVGMVSGQDSGTYGPLYLDELSFRR